MDDVQIPVYSAYIYVHTYKNYNFSVFLQDVKMVTLLSINH